MDNKEDIQRIEEDLKEIKQDVKSLLLFMAVEQAKNKQNIVLFSAGISLVVSITTLAIGKFL